MNKEYPNWAHVLFSCYISAHRQLPANLYTHQYLKYSVIPLPKKQSKPLSCHLKACYSWPSPYLLLLVNSTLCCDSLFISQKYTDRNMPPHFCFKPSSAWASPRLFRLYRKVPQSGSSVLPNAWTKNGESLYMMWKLEPLLIKWKSIMGSKITTFLSLLTWWPSGGELPPQCFYLNSPPC